MSNDITELRTILFDTLRNLKDGKIEPEKAKAINVTAQVIINSAKVEVDYMKVSGVEVQNNFIEGSKKDENLPKGIVGVRQHRIK